MKDLIVEIWLTVKQNKLRTFLTGFSVVWGVFMIILLLGAGNGMINAQKLQTDRYISNSMAVYGGMTSKPYGGYEEGRVIKLNNKDFEMTRTKFKKNIIDVVGVRSKENISISYQNYYVLNTIKGTFPAEQTINKITMLHGRFINDFDIKASRKVIVLNEDDAKELIKSPLATLIGKYVKSNNLLFQVIGIYKKDDLGMINGAFIPFTSFNIAFGQSDDIDKIVFSFKGLQSQASNDDFEKEYQKALNQNHDVAPDDINGFWISNRFMQNLQSQIVMKIIRISLWVIGLLTLISGVVGISNIMLITVKERTKEIGIRKAIGAKPLSILKQIMLESIIITGFFGYIGMILGILSNIYMDMTIGHEEIDAGMFKTTVFYNPVVEMDVCIMTTLVMVISGTLAGIFPAIKASRIRPIEALSFE